ncbi:hypothetical protein [Chryseobacterium potabilaquae]|uniref:YD repeat-containing protein n=1 Tax=Chryseobacterium potabilaquae TaxID=2675057 RepID=A0A6N4XCB0_9FLAO|nr:hypothetical protein [Chryseobacterium potabilaquae]CAA7197099.1 hypothetical protein CHRY9293_03156 [Chryseobacterium potabilaquae]
MKNLFLGFIALAITVSCNSSNDDIATPTRPIVVDNSPILPNKVFVQGTDIDPYNLTYSYVGTKLKEIVRHDGVKYSYTYSGNNITKEIWTINGVVRMIKEFSYTSSGMITSVKVTNNLVSPAVVYTQNIEIVDNSHIRYDEYDPQDGTVLYKVDAYFDNLGNRIKSVYNNSLTEASSFDLKMNPFNNITGYKALNMVQRNIGGIIGEGLAGSNNILKSGSNFTCTNSYYTSDKYPYATQSNNNGKSITTKYYYNRVE